MNYGGHFSCYRMNGQSVCRLPWIFKKGVSSASPLIKEGGITAISTGLPFGGVMSYYRIVVILKSKSSKRLRRKVISLVRGKSWEGKNGITSRRCRENPICDLLALRLI